MVTQRLSEYLEAKGINQYTFEVKIGVSQGSISKAIKQNKSIGSQRLENILNSFPDLSPEWLLTGKGEMLREVKEGKDTEEYLPLLSTDNILRDPGRPYDSRPIEEVLKEKLPLVSDEERPIAEEYFNKLLEEKKINAKLQQEIKEMKEQLVNAERRVAEGKEKQIGLQEQLVAAKDEVVSAERRVSEAKDEALRAYKKLADGSKSKEK